MIEPVCSFMNHISAPHCGSWVRASLVVCRSLAVDVKRHHRIRYLGLGLPSHGGEARFLREEDVCDYGAHVVVVANCWICEGDAALRVRIK